MERLENTNEAAGYYFLLVAFWGAYVCCWLSGKKSEVCGLARDLLKPTPGYIQPARQQAFTDKGMRGLLPALCIFDLYHAENYRACAACPTDLRLAAK